MSAQVPFISRLDIQEAVDRLPSEQRMIVILTLPSCSFPVCHFGY
ncbi:hypothetical protein [Caldalkalibacillus thermarum]|nr:hypothetical protein [Caldalkalibacillus thermarum]